MKTLEEHNIESRPVWKLMHLQPVFEKYDFYTAEKEKPFSETAFETGLCQPSGSSLTESDVEIIINRIKTCLSRCVQ